MTAHTTSPLQRTLASVRRIWSDLDRASRLLVEVPRNDRY